jgi:DNA primase small subunit
MSKISTEAFLRSKFAEYYRSHSDKIILPPQHIRREFGFIPFREQIMIRHRSFLSVQQLLETIQDIAPAHAYYSSAYYERPQEEMDQKGWLGADLIFDIDADHLPTVCGPEHRYWICKNCGTISVRTKSEQCQQCGGTKYQEERWICENCLEAAKHETLKLIDFLTTDFGFDIENLEICFSGHRGYHVHVEEENVSQLDQSARREIVDYVYGNGISLENHGFSSIIPSMKSLGWKGRLSRGLYNLLNTPSEHILSDGKAVSSFKRLNAHREEILQNLENDSQMNTPKGVGKKTWEALIEAIITNEIPRVDSVVTTDIHRLTRLIGTLHGKTGLIVLRISVDHLEDFHPLIDAVAFREGSIKVNVHDVERFKIGESEYGPFKNSVVELPTAAAILLLCKKVASLA